MVHETLTLRMLNPADSTELATLEAACFATAWDAVQFSAAMQQPVFVAFGAFYSDELIAYVTAYRNNVELEILNVGVHPDKRGQKIGTYLLSHVLQAAQKNGVAEAILEVRPANTPAVRLYSRLGFEKTGLRKGYYPDTKEDAAVYCKYL